MKVVCYGFLCFICSIALSNDNDTLNNVIRNLEQMIKYYREVLTWINLDALYGLRVLEGELHRFVLDIKKGYLKLPEPVAQRVIAMYTEANAICNDALPHVKEDYPSYYKKLHYLVDQEQEITHNLYTYKYVDPSLKWRKEQLITTVMTEEISDRCMSQLLGTADVPPESSVVRAADVRARLENKGVRDESAGDNEDTNVCNFTTDCLDWMLLPGHAEYHVTHQLLFTMLATKRNCERPIIRYLKEKYLADSIEEYQHILCTNVYYEMITNLRLQPNIPAIYMDLLMEQQYVCPSLGYVEFLHIDWLHQILSWQQPNGCYSEAQGPKTDQSPKRRSLNRAEPNVAQNNHVVIQQPIGLTYNSGGIHNKTQLDIINTKHEDVDLEKPQKVINMQDEDTEEYKDHDSPQTGEKIIREQDILGDYPGPREIFEGVPNKLHDSEMVFDDNYSVEQDYQKDNIGNLDAANLNDNIARQDVGHGVGNLMGSQERQDVGLMHDGRNAGMRKLLLEKEMTDGCLLHMTAVASGCLSQYLRVLVQEYYVTIDVKKNHKQWKLNGPNPISKSSKPTKMSILKLSSEKNAEQVNRNDFNEHDNVKIDNDEQYIEEDPDWAAHHQVAPPPKQTSRVEVKLADHRGAAVILDDDQHDGYVYYDDEEEDDEAKRVANINDRTHNGARHSVDRGKKSDVKSSRYEGHPLGGLGPGPMTVDSMRGVYAAVYCFVMLVILALLYLLCRFVRQRRVVIRYHYR